MKPISQNRNKFKILGINQRDAEMMNSLKDIVVMVVAVIAVAAGAPETHAALPANITIVNKWSGEFPVSEIGRLPEGQREAAAGFIDEPETFGSVWQVFKPGETPPEIDFDRNMVVYVRNVVYYNRTHILKVTLTDGIANIVAMETRSALPIEEKAAMAMAEISRKGVRAIRAGERLIPLRSNPGNTSYLIEGHEIDLIDGGNQREAAPGSASKITTTVFGAVEVGDLNDDGRTDAALVLVQSTGGTGTFFYAAAAINRTGGYRGTNAVFLGDRIAVQGVSVRNGVIVVDYRDRSPGEPMATPPTVAKSAYLTVRNGELTAVGLLAEEEHVVVDSPAPGATIVSPLTVSGRARGAWFFEGDFPMSIVDTNGSVIGQGYCTAKGPWMTDKFVPFEGTIAFGKPGSVEQGVLILQKDNPTGLPKHDDALEIPVFIR